MTKRTTKYTIPRGYRASKLSWKRKEDANDVARHLRKQGKKVKVVSTGKMYRLLIK